MVRFIRWPKHYGEIGCQSMVLEAGIQMRSASFKGIGDDYPSKRQEMVQDLSRVTTSSVLSSVATRQAHTGPYVFALRRSDKKPKCLIGPMSQFNCGTEIDVYGQR